MTTRLISARECNALVEPPRVVLPDGAAAGEHFARAVLGRAPSYDVVPAAMLGDVIKPYEEVVVHAWSSAMRVTVVPIDEHGSHDGNERLAPRDRLRLAALKGLALVGLTTASPARGRLARALGFGAPVPLGRVLWYDVIDRARGVLHDYDSAWHYIDRVGRLNTVEGALRAGFRAVRGGAGAAPRFTSAERLNAVGSAARERLAEPVADSVEDTTTVVGVVLAAASVEEWIRVMVLDRFPKLNEFYIRTVDSVPDLDGNSRRFVVRRSDWESEAFQ